MAETQNQAPDTETKEAVTTTASKTVQAPKKTTKTTKAKAEAETDARGEKVKAGGFQFYVKG